MLTVVVLSAVTTMPVMMGLKVTAGSACARLSSAA